jgi:hypothetical protein
LFRRLAAVLSFVQKVGYLNGVWCAKSDSISDASPRSRATTLVPGCSRSQFASVADSSSGNTSIGRRTARFTNQQQAIAQWSSVQREIIHPQLGRRLTHGEVLVAQQTAQAIWAGWQTRSSRESGSSLTAGSLGERQQETSRLFRPATVARQESLESLRKDLAQASGFVAEEAPRPDAQAHGELAPGQVQGRASIHHVCLRALGVPHTGQIALAALGTTFIITDPSGSTAKLVIRQRSFPTSRSSASIAAPPTASLLAISLYRKTFIKFADKPRSRWPLTRDSIAKRLAQCGLELHLDKTCIVYCKDENRRAIYGNERFDFLG